MMDFLAVCGIALALTVSFYIAAKGFEVCEDVEYRKRVRKVYEWHNKHNKGSRGWKG